MSDYAGLNSPQSWWVKGEAERYLNEKNNAIESFGNSIKEAEITTNLDYDREHRDFAFLVLSNQSLGLIYENNDNQKALYHIQEAIKIAYNTGNVLLFINIYLFVFCSNIRTHSIYFSYWFVHFHTWT